ncbi:MAG: VWA domain-containing protein [Chloroflexi bacterium]|nr:VWA domain-containing protein [Chloroflexota bacterium]
MTFEWPLLLWSLVLLPILFGFYLLAQRRRRAYALRFTNLALLKEVVGRRPGLRRHLPPLLFLLGLGALLVSLARPSAVIAVPRDEASIVLVLDVSGSMAASDLKPTRIEAARQAALSFIQALPANTKVGLVSFSNRAQVVAPLTRDHTAVLAALRTLQAEGGTAIGDGLALGLEVLRRGQTEGAGGQQPGAQSGSQQAGSQAGNAAANEPLVGTVILLSDGATSAGQPPAQAASRAAQAGVTVHTVGMGQRNSNVRVRGGTPADLDERSLQEIARTTGGEYFYAAQSADLERIYSSISTQVSWNEEKTEVTALMSAAGTLLMVAAGLFSLRWLHGLP